MNGLFPKGRLDFLRVQEALEKDICGATVCLNNSSHLKSLLQPHSGGLMSCSQVKEIPHQPVENGQARSG